MTPENQKKTALITGITGQDGAYLARHLLDLGYEVHGMVRWDAPFETDEDYARLAALDITPEDITPHHADVMDATATIDLVKTVQPDEIYNLAALSHVGVSFKTPVAAFDANAKGPYHLLEAIRLLDLQDKTKFYQASSSEMFGNCGVSPQNEETSFHPCSPYGIAKLSAYWTTRLYRETHGIFAVNGILFNHESPLRGCDFVTQKIIRYVAGDMAEPLMLGNLDARRDWGHAADYVRGMHMMMRHDTADDFVLAGGAMVSVRDFATKAFAVSGISLTWEGTGENEVARNAGTGEILVRIDPALYRPSELHELCGDASKAKNILGWQAEKSLDDLIADMIDFERTRKLPPVKERRKWRKTG